MSHITIIIGSGNSVAAVAGEKSIAEATVSYTPAHGMSWDEIGKEVEKIEKKIDGLLQ